MWQLLFFLLSYFLMGSLIQKSLSGHALSLYYGELVTPSRKLLRCVLGSY